MWEFLLNLFHTLSSLSLFLSPVPSSLILMVLAVRSHDGSSRESRVWLAEQQVKGMWDIVCIVCVCLALERTAAHMCVFLSNIVNTSWLEAALLFAYFLWYLKEKSPSWCLWGDDQRQKSDKTGSRLLQGSLGAGGLQLWAYEPAWGRPKQHMCWDSRHREGDHMIPSYPPAERPVENTDTLPLCSLARTKAAWALLFYTAFSITVAVVNSSTQGGGKVFCAIKPHMLPFATQQTWLLNWFLMILFYLISSKLSKDSLKNINLLVKQNYKSDFYLFK